MAQKKRAKKECKRKQQKEISVELEMVENLLPAGGRACKAIERKYANNGGI
jgi:hypothetical protein